MHVDVFMGGHDEHERVTERSRIQQTSSIGLGSARQNSGTAGRSVTTGAVPLTCPLSNSTASRERIWGMNRPVVTNPTRAAKALF